MQNLHLSHLVSTHSRHTLLLFPSVNVRLNLSCMTVCVCVCDCLSPLNDVCLASGEVTVIDGMVNCPCSASSVVNALPVDSAIKQHCSPAQTETY